jgi:hypothetical protein
MPCIPLPAKYVQLLLHCYNLKLLLKHIALTAHACRLLFLIDDLPGIIIHWGHFAAIVCWRLCRVARE